VSPEAFDRDFKQYLARRQLVVFEFGRRKTAAQRVCRDRRSSGLAPAEFEHDQLTPREVLLEVAIEGLWTDAGERASPGDFHLSLTHVLQKPIEECGIGFGPVV